MTSEADRGACPDSDDGEHEWAVSQLIVENDGMSKRLICNYCGAESYEASAGDDEDRPPL